jgi:hypothetical protein
MPAVIVRQFRQKPNPDAAFVLETDNPPDGGPRRHLARFAHDLPLPVVNAASQLIADAVATPDASTFILRR